MVTIYHLKDLMSGRKQRIKGTEVRHIQIPYYEGLTVKDIAAWTNEQGGVGEYLPDGKEIFKLPREYIGNVCATIHQDKFANWVKEQVQNRND